MGLLAYTDPTTSSLSSYMERSYRESIADKVNSRILSVLGLHQKSSLEICIQQLMTVEKMRKQLTHGMTVPVQMEL
jgi:hypothetical protein